MGMLSRQSWVNEQWQFGHEHFVAFRWTSVGRNLLSIGTTNLNSDLFAIETSLRLFASSVALSPGERDQCQRTTTIPTPLESNRNVSSSKSFSLLFAFDRHFSNDQSLRHLLGFHLVKRSRRSALQSKSIEDSFSFDVEKFRREKRLFCSDRQPSADRQVGWSPIVLLVIDWHHHLFAE